MSDEAFSMPEFRDKSKEQFPLTFLCLLLFSFWVLTLSYQTVILTTNNFQKAEHVMREFKLVNSINYPGMLVKSFQESISVWNDEDKESV